jgi:hypothetical protein
VRERPHIATLFAIAVILASAVNLAVIYFVTSRPRPVFQKPVQAVAAKQPTPEFPRPTIAIEEALKKSDLTAVKQHMYWCRKDGTCDLDRNLRAAASSNNPAITKVLIAAGAKVNTADRDRGTPLHSAATTGRTTVARVLLEAGAEVNARDDEGLTPLHSAAAWGHVELARVLISAGADANAGDRRRQTPLHVVASRRVPPLAGYASVARLLLNAGARPNARAADGSTPLHLARLAAMRLSLEGNLKAAADANEVVGLLRDHGGHE